MQASRPAEPGIPTPPDGGKLPPPRLPPPHSPPGRGQDAEETPDLGPTAPRSPSPERPAGTPDRDMPPDRQPGIPTGPGGHG